MIMLISEARLTPPFQPAHDGIGRNASDYRDQHDLRRVGHGNAVQEEQASIDLFSAKPKGGREPEERCKHRQDVDGMADPAPDPLFEDWIKGGPDRQRKALVEGKERQRKPHDRINRPGLQPQW